MSIGKAWYRTSHLNSTLFAVEADGSVVAHMIYDPWGAPLLETYTDTNYSGLDNLNNFTGYAWDEVLGLYYAQNRFYDAATHRFTQEDAVKDGGNWYAYCGNDPLNYTDPNGEFGLLAATAIAAGAAALISGGVSAYQSYKSTGRVDWKQAGKAAVGGAAAAVGVGIAVATGGTGAGVAVMATEAIAGGVSILHGGNASDVASSMGTSGVMSAVGGQALAKAPAIVQNAVGVTSAVIGANQTSQNVKTTAQTLSDENATTRQKAAAIVDTALSAAGTVGSAMLAASSAREAAQELATVKGYFEKAQCPGAGQAASGGYGENSQFQKAFDLADNYTLSDDVYNNHIIDRHGPSSIYEGKSHFNADFNLKEGIDSTLRSDKSIVKSNTAGRAGYIFEQTFSNPIGTSSNGKPLYTLKVVIDELGNVVTAFPKK